MFRENKRGEQLSACLSPCCEIQDSNTHTHTHTHTEGEREIGTINPQQTQLYLTSGNTEEEGLLNKNRATRVFLFTLCLPHQGTLFPPQSQGNEKRKLGPGMGGWVEEMGGGRL